jgi:aspartyl-tRNA(Asn)/glutamyl-tRNA(Gln) amidotransferase subunit A
MPKPPAITAAEIENIAKRHGLTNFAPEHLARLAELADKVAETGRALPRLPSKSDEPAHVFRVPQK